MSARLPWVALGGGGYNLGNVARAWTLVWAIMNDVKLKEKMPGEFIDMAKKFGIEGDYITDKPFGLEQSERKNLLKLMQGDIAFLKKDVLPLVNQMIRD